MGSILYPATAYFQSELLKDDPYTYTVNEEMVGYCKIEPFIKIDFALHPLFPLA